MSMYNIDSIYRLKSPEFHTPSIKKLLNYNRWPGVHNYVTDIRVLVCNEQTLIVQISLAFALAMHMFWTSFFPSPREVERKFFTGGYRCGFFLDVKVKSPVEIIFGRGASTIIGEIVRPAATLMYYFWLEQVALTAMSTFTTLIYPFLFCQDNIGDGLRRSDVGTFGQGHNEGVPGLGAFKFDRYGFMSLTNCTVFFPPGYWTVYVAWFVKPTPWPIENLKLGIHDSSHPNQMADMEPRSAGEPATHVTDVSGYSAEGAVISAWAEGDLPLGALVSQVEAVMFTYSWSPIPFPPPYGDLQGPSGPPHGRQPWDFRHFGPEPPPLCLESS